MSVIVKFCIACPLMFAPTPLLIVSTPHNHIVVDDGAFITHLLTPFGPTNVDGLSTSTILLNYTIIAPTFSR